MLQQEIVDLSARLAEMETLRLQLERYKTKIVMINSLLIVKVK